MGELAQKRLRSTLAPRTAAGYGEANMSTSLRTVRQFRMVLAVPSRAARYSLVSLLRAAPLG